MTVSEEPTANFPFNSSLGPLSSAVVRRVSQLAEDQFPSRLWSGDPSLWTTDPQGQAEIRKRLGWLRLPETSRARVKEIISFADEIHQAGIKKCLLLGMGGSSLAPEVMSRTFNVQRPAFDFAILDSTDPAQVAQAAKDFPPSESLYIVSSKSGGTAEVNAIFDYFWHLSGGDGSRFVAITDPGTSLDALANARGFHKTFLADPSVGGRFSVLADFGLLPAALMSFDIERILASAAAMMHACGVDIPATQNPGLVLGAVMGEAALAGRDKLTLIADPQVAAFGSWLEQLIAESSGKQGKGIVVVDGEPVTDLDGYGDDRLFVYLKVTGEYGKSIAALKAAGHPVFEFLIPDTYSLISEFYRWEIATATACHILGVNAFDQPDVQDNKNRTKEKINSYSQYGILVEPQPFWSGNLVRAFTNQDLAGTDLEAILGEFLALAKSGSYVAINAYIPRHAETLTALTDLRLKVRSRTGCATTVGFGPRFLHSTGQLHKGGPESGLFLQITADPAVDFDIPGEGFTFGVLERAQALGDYEALAARGRKILRVHLTSPDAVQKLVDAVK